MPNQKVALISVEVGRRKVNISMEWKFNVFKLVIRDMLVQEGGV